MNRSLACLRCRGLRAKARALPARTFADNKRPPTAPKPIIDIKHVRQNPELYERTCLERNYRNQAAHPARILELHSQWQALQRQGRALRERSNLLRKFLANPATSSGDDDVQDIREMSRQQVQDEARRLKGELSGIEKGEAAAAAEMEALALEMPNLTSDDTPRGHEALVLGYINSPPAAFDKSPENKVWRSHVHVGSELGLLDFSGAAAASGWGWYYLVGEAAQLEQALVQYALAVATRHGWTQVSPPTMVYSHIGAACGFRPRDQHGEQQVYAVARSEADADRGVPELCLAGTSEIALAGMKANAAIDPEDLPMKRVAVSRCYRAEAGARGADTKGLYRVHEFTKVEMFAWTSPSRDEEQDVYQEMLDVQAEIMQSLGLYCRVLSMPAADLGASAARKVDVEAWFPSRQSINDGWGELTSASTCTDYQTRRLATRTRVDGKVSFPWTCNGTALAVPRVMAALFENGWDEETGTVAIPEVLRPWMDGLERIGRVGRRRNAHEVTFTQKDGHVEEA
ncbi:Seryl-tRNA synthetase, class IIa [Metarhizium album ARSEF 1941]|uniref:serine--tRNA ligase n=1 Tax=Metarhizium album (strain ARSEF 1941) TaxID=1081103 RepID=A0A0B2WY65_METAS|nr:Seryl-tRNA synthetase, class IIa [Metarhizium album ARSEF 1941]KHN97765.1 Seryl-tRNA synthetase, class IIa [Metarhizium album ARSEF 1941]